MLDRGTKQYTPAAMAAVPLIPGLLSTQRHFIGRANFHKGQVLERMAQGRLVDVAADSNPTGATSKANEVSRATATVQRATAAATATATATSKPSPPPASSAFRAAASQPAWLAHDRQVLRFFGYLLEPAAADDDKAPLVRRVVLLFYLSDHSLAVSEPRVANSGLAQGAFLKRTRSATTSSGEPFAPRDFSVGGRIKLYGRTLHLVDCDAATRAYYADALAAPQGDALKYPDDASSQLDEVAALRTRLAERRARETESGAARARQFHAHAGGAVLRFFVSWRDPHPLYPETRRYALHYYLSDDTLELVEPKREREGRGHFAVLLSRRRVERVHARALRCGECVEVCARRFLLEDCDAFTRAYYLEAFGVTQEPHAPQEQQPARDAAAAKWKLFRAAPAAAEADGGDRMGPRFRRKEDGEHSDQGLAEREDKQLRFRARLLGPRAAGGRELVLTFFLADGTLSVFEPRVANSGVAGGRFLDRGRFRKAAATATATASSNGGAYVKAQDLYVGAVLAFAFAPQQQLELLEADRQTLAYCESHADAFPFSDATAVLASVAATATTSMPTMRRAWRLADAARGGSLAVGDARRVLETLGLGRALNAQQLVTLCRAFEDGGDDEPHAGGGPRPFLYDDFCDALALAMAPSLSSASPASGDVLTRLRSCRVLRRLLREADPQRQRVVATAELMRVAAAAKVSLSHSEALALATRFPGSHRQRRDVFVDYNALCDRVFDGGDVVDTDQKSSAALPQNERERRTDRQQEIAKQHHSDEEDDELGVWATPNQHSLGRRRNDPGDRHGDDDDEFAHFGGDDDGEANLSPDEPTPRGRQAPAYESPRRHNLIAPHVSPPALTRPLPARATHSSAMPPAPAPSKGTEPRSTDTRVVALLRRVFSDRKYLLRKALRDRDADKSGLLGEEAFMAAVLAVEPRLSDDDTYLLADVYFPTNNSVIDYTKLLESAFRT